MILNLKYELNHGNISGDTYKCEIYKVGTYEGDVIELDGYCIHSYKSVKNIFEPIRGASLNISFIASLTEPFDDFNVVQEFQFFVVFFRNNIAIFTGWILPDGISQSYVKDNWEVTLQAVDGLGFLKNYEYLPEVVVGLPLSSPTITNVYPQEFNILYTILARCGYNIPIATFDDINQGFDPTTGEPFGSVDFANINSRIVNKEVFLNKNGNYFDCETILKDILQKYNFILFQGVANNELCWIITRPHFQLTANVQKGSIWKPASISGNKIIFERDSTFTTNTNTIYSNYDSENGLLHCNENQLINYNPAIQNFRFDQKWLGLRNQYYSELTDEFFDQLVFTNPIDQFVESGMQIASAAPGGGSTAVFEQDNYIDLPIDYEDLTFKFEISVTGDFSSDYSDFFNFTITGQRLNDSGTTTQYVLIYNAENQLTWIPLTGPSVLALETNLSGILINSKVFLEVKAPFLQNLTNFKITFRRGFFNSTSVQVVNKVGVFWTKLPLGIGEFHDSKLVNFKSSFLNDPVKIINSNQNDDVFLNNLYQNISGNLVPQASWNLNDTAPIYDDILELTSRERLTMLSRPQMLFSGDVYGYLPYFNRIIYDKINGQFLILNYSFNSKTNVTRLECSQAFIESVEKTYLQTYYFEDEKNVLIKEIN